eukprot:TRINITY_DN48534_c0_g1_i1.p1 TRINITY_DN48534_c0_g1~~TRINITY_DN48534_c0_g1_i1.p1  ORF type:complete len:755 (+),score=105.09 TRINITY_DN48534_c0_g1_i1:131-2266(+)
MAIISQPFAELTSLEEPVPLVNLGEAGPMRCTRCKAYVNPFFTWQNNGKEAICNFCKHQIDVPLDYMCSLDEYNQRIDKERRPELKRGTVDYIAPSDYSDAMPSEPATIFVIEATQRSLQSGFLPQVMWTLKSLLGFLEPPSSKIGVILFDQALHFFALYPGLDCARQITVTDIEDPFVPCGADALLADAQDPAFRNQFEDLLEELPSMLCANGAANEAAGNAALKVAAELMASRGGGHVVMCHASLPNVGIAALRNRDNLNLSRESEGGGLFTVQQKTFVDEIANNCLDKGVAVSVFCAPCLGTYMDLATLTSIPRRTGGDIFLYQSFDPQVDGERLHFDLCRTTVQDSAHSVTFKLRCSKGLTVQSMCSPLEAEVNVDPSTFTISRLSVDAAANFELVHGERMEGQKLAYVQVACLYTNRKGERLIRVHTIQLPLTTSLSNVFRYTEVDAVTNLLIKQAALSALRGDGGFKDVLNKKCVDMLHSYRTNCASTTAAGQLILPESLKLLPLYIGSIRKMPAFRAGSDMKVDDRIVALLRILALPVSLTAPLVYPKVYSMYPLPENGGLPTGIGENVYMPPCVPGWSEKMAADSIYLIDNGSSLRLYVRPEVSEQTLIEAFGVQSLREFASIFLAHSEDSSVTEAVERILGVVQQIRRDRSRLPWQGLSVALPGTPEESRALASLAEDCVGSEMNYVDFLCHIHKMVQNKQD